MNRSAIVHGDGGANGSSSGSPFAGVTLRSVHHYTIPGSSPSSSLSCGPHQAQSGSHIPLPSKRPLANGLVRAASAFAGHNGASETLAKPSSSVAAHRAAFEKLDAAAATTTSINGSSSPTTAGSGLAKLSRMPSCPGSQTLTQSQSQTSSGSRSPSLARSNSFQDAAKWKSKYEEAEKRRKLMLHKSEAVNRDHADLERRYQQVLRQNGLLQAQVQENSEKLEKMRTVSEAVCKEYEQLKRQYDVETGAMHKAMQQASQWYKQNRELKRRSQVITQRYLQSNPDALDELGPIQDDEVDNHADADIEQLRETVKELSQEVAKLQTELSAARLQEFEAQEQVTLLTAQLEEERLARQDEGGKMRELKVHKENIERVTKLVADEVETLKAQCDRERENARQMKLEADRMQKERNVLAHQSALLMADVGSDPSGRLLSLLQEVEGLKRALEEERQSSAAQIQQLQERLEEKEANVEFEIVEEKLRLAESELELINERAERAETRAEELQRRLSEIETCGVKSNVAAPPPPPPPPSSGASSARLICSENGSRQPSAISDMQNMLGRKAPSAPQQLQQPAIDDVINQIKGGRFTLKHTDKQREEERRRKQEAENKPPAVSEMLSILGTMRRRAKPTRNSFKLSNGAS